MIASGDTGFVCTPQTNLSERIITVAQCLPVQHRHRPTPLRSLYNNSRVPGCHSAPVKESIYLILLILFTALACQGCTISLEKTASILSMTAATVDGNPFLHRVFTLPHTGENPTTVKIFIVDGDGRAFIDRTKVASDPTANSSSLLAMATALADLGNVVYLGRPCYHQLNDPNCNPTYWTLARFSPEVVQSSVAATRRLVQEGDRVYLLGYSGGGVIAMLMARELKSQVFGVVTFGSPLDHRAWTQFHGYTPLSLSQNPAQNVESFFDFCQTHLIGTRDKVVPASLSRTWGWLPYKDSNYLDSDHYCCWQQSALEALEKQIKNCAGD